MQTFVIRLIYFHSLLQKAKLSGGVVAEPNSKASSDTESNVSMTSDHLASHGGETTFHGGSECQVDISSTAGICDYLAESKSMQSAKIMTPQELATLREELKKRQKAALVSALTNLQLKTN